MAAVEGDLPRRLLIKVVTASAAIERGNVFQDEIATAAGSTASRAAGSTPGTEGDPEDDPRGDRPLRQRRVREGGGHHVGGPVLEEYLTKF